MWGVAHDVRSVLQNHRNSIISLEVLICNVTLVCHVLKTLYVCVVLVRGSVEINHRGRRSSLRTLEDRKKWLSSCLSQTSVVSDIFSVLISVFLCYSWVYDSFNMPFIIWSCSQKLSKCFPRFCLKRFYVLYFYLILSVSTIVSDYSSIWHKSWIVAQIFRSKRL